MKKATFKNYVDILKQKGQQTIYVLSIMDKLCLLILNYSSNNNFKN